MNKAKKTVKKSVDTEQIRTNNRNEIIHTLRTFGPMARVEICRITQLSPATVTAITAELLKQNQLREINSDAGQNTGRGRPKVVVDLNPTYQYVVGVKVSINKLRFILGDYTGNIVDQKTVEIDTLSLDSSEFVLHLQKLINEYCTEKATAEESLNVTAIGVAIQGVVDANEGKLIWSPALSFKNTHIANPLRQALGLPIVIANDANCIALSIMQAPEYLSVKNFVVIMLGYGIGMGMVVDGQLYSGYHGSAAEFGHTKFSYGGPMCHCGKRGCIEAYVSDYGIYRDAKVLISPTSTEPHSFFPSASDMQQLYQLAANGEKEITALFEQAGRVLGFGVANVIALLSPESVVITGSGIEAFPYMQHGLETGLKESLAPGLQTQTMITPFPWDQDITAKGIVGLALQQSQVS